MSDLMKKIDVWHRQVGAAVVTRAAAHTTLKRARAAVVAGEAEYDAAEEAQQITQAVAKTIQEEAHDRIAGVVTRSLAAVFDVPYEFNIEFEQARGRTEARLVFTRDGVGVNPIDASGGGVVDVAAYALRLSCLMLTRPACRRLVVLDEPFRFINPKNFTAVRAMFASLARELGVQFIMVTNIDALRCGHIVEVAG